MAVIPAGTFTLGAMKKQATVGRYCLDVNEVSVADFKLCVDASSCRAPDGYVEKKDDWGQFCNWQRSDRRDHPVNCVDWSQATAYCAWTKKRLPTESEWEWAARSGDKGWNYPWGNSAPDGSQANACGIECAPIFDRKMTETVTPLYGANDGWEDTAPVGSFPKGDNLWGVHDLAGNVAEWTDGAFDDAAIDVARIQRGGHWRLGDGRGADLMASARERREPDSRRGSVGFRCAMSP
jgi:formylglycine-generating enzyme required for sulfatase activity